MDREEVVRVAREKMGLTARMATGEYGMLARILEPAERIEAMVLTQPAGRLLARGVLITATDRRLLLVSKTMVTRRERCEEVVRGRVRGARLEPGMRFVLDVDGEERAYAFGQPPVQVAELVAWARRQTSGAGELEDMARRKFGRVLGFGTETEVVLLAAQLAADEAVLDLAYTTAKPYGLLALTTSRLVFVRQRGLRSGPPPESWALATIEEVADDDGSLLVDGRRYERLMPEQASGTFVTRMRARISRESGLRP